MVDWSNVDIPLHEGVNRFLAGLNPQLEWAERGVSGHEANRLSQQKLDQAISQAKETLQTPEGKDHIVGFTNAAQQMCDQLLQDFSRGSADFLDQFFPNKKFIFIIGEMRTGGTYLLQEMYRLYQLDHKNFGRFLIHDAIPEYTTLIHYQKPEVALKFFYQLSQFLVWAYHAFKDSPVVIQKRSGYGFCLELIDRLFGNKATYLVPIRHPYTMSDSIAKLHNINPADPEAGSMLAWIKVLERYKKLSIDQINKLSHTERMTFFWQVHHELMVAPAPLKGEFIPLAYGPDCEKYIRSEYVKQEHDLNQASPFQLKEQTPQTHWPSPQLADQIYATVQKVWQSKGYALPSLNLY